MLRRIIVEVIIGTLTKYAVRAVRVDSWFTRNPRSRFRRW
jgi:hypothetical protein